jgi:hypothetical protein
MYALAGEYKVMSGNIPRVLIEVEKRAGNKVIVIYHWMFLGAYFASCVRMIASAACDPVIGIGTL